MARSKNKLSKRQQAIYDYIIVYTDEHGYPPSVREIGNAVGLASPSTVHMHLKTLEDRGYIKRFPNKSRTIEVIKRAPELDLVDIRENIEEGAIILPLIGNVAAGTPVLAEQNVEDMLVLPTSIVSDSSTFMLRVHGDSMINAGIFNGDYIVVREQSEAENGDIVVALIDDSATVKTFYREEGRIRLQPENDMMQPIYVENPHILGRVTALIRSIS